MVSIDNLVVAFSGTTLFDNVTFMVNPRDRIGLVGKNGAGKSTLLKIITGLQNPTSGHVAIPDDIKLGYLPQIMKVSGGRTVMEEVFMAFAHLQDLEKRIEEITVELGERTDYESAPYMKLIEQLNEVNDKYHILGGDNREGEAEKALRGLGFKRRDFTRQTTEFSGGWRMRIELAKILLQHPDLILLDEPTNHLDIESIQWLEDYLKNYLGALILISHDRAFLDAVTNRTIELLLGKAYDYRVSYSKYVELRKERREQQVAAYTNQQKAIEKTEEFIERFRYKATKSNQVQSRIKMLEKIDRIEIDDEDTSALNMKFPPAPRSGQVVYQAKDISKRFDGKVIFSGANITVERGERVAFVGRNGEGKTTMSKILVGTLPYEEGESKLGHNVNIGYFAQNQDDLMDGEFTVFDTLDKVATGEVRTKLRDILGAFLFRGEDVDKKVKVLSGGERSRLAMARLMLEPYNLLVLDEPTNHMDMRSKDILKNALLKYDGTLIVVSHDREFLDGLVDKIYEFRDGRVKEHLGTIWDFMQRLKLESMRELEAAKVVEEKKVEVKKEEKGKETASVQNYQEKKEQDKQQRKLQKKVEALEKQIEELDMEIEKMDTLLAENPQEATADFFEKYNALKKQQENVMWEWGKLIG
ncbi:MAG: ABC-F family ATP-binding cassette domain-containing protein [Prevotellaceae bacterium]|jgi:ATP-binding cassette subfamily F protein 3|nr:ABC-F family ATP-binding cassette domain-containing protein [Prevotellaceae bacterium]